MKALWTAKKETKALIRLLPSYFDTIGNQFIKEKLRFESFEMVINFCLGIVNNRMNDQNLKHSHRFVSLCLKLYTSMHCNNQPTSSYRRKR